MAADLKDRYPGLRPFRADEKDVFYGRDVEARELTDLVRAERSIILFSKSGLGKSSLLNAKVCPQLTAYGFWPILIRFQPETQEEKGTNKGFSPVDVVVDRLRTEFDLAYQNLAKQVADWKNEALKQPAQPVGELILASADGTDGKPQPNEDKQKRLTEAIQKGEKNLEKAKLNETKFVPAQSILFNKEEPYLWEQVKIHRFPNNEVPIFVFDQFEEFFAYPVGAQQVFGQQLAELMHDQLPTRVMNWLLDIPRDDRKPETLDWGKQPTLKCLLSIRSDRLFEIDSLKQYIPFIVRNGYRLNPLHDDQARDAIDKPAQAEGDYRTPKFSFGEAFREEIIGELCNDDCEIESSQLQIVCQYFENYVKKQPEGNGPIVIDKFDGTDTIKRIISQFYRNQLATLNKPQDIGLARQVLEKELVIDHHRVGLAEGRMKKLLNNRTDIIEKLEEARLIRAEETHLGKTYELSHDTLIEPVEQEKQAEAERQRRLLKRRQVGVVFVVLLGLAVLAIIDKRNGNISLANANSDWASDEYGNGNQRKAYRLWESSDELLSILGIRFSHKLENGTDSLILSPFAGINTQINSSDTSLHYVANLYKANYFELWEKVRDSSTLDSLYKKQDWLDSLGLKLASQLQLRNDRLVVFNSDSTLQVVDLKNHIPIFPDTDVYTFPSLKTLLNKGRVTISENGAIRPIPTVLLPPRGNWLAVLDASVSVQAHLYDLRNQGDEHEGFKAIVRKTPKLSLDNITFSASEDFLLVKYPGMNKYDLLTLRTSQKPTAYVNMLYADFSPSGKYLTTISTSGQLVIRELATKQVRYAGMAWQQGRTAQLTELIFNRDESVLAIVTKGQMGKGTNRSSATNLFTIKLKSPKPVLTVIAKNIVDYQSFGWAGHLLFFGETPDSSYNYNLNTGTKQALPSGRYVPVNIGKTSVLYTRSPDDKRLYLYDVLSGNVHEITKLVSTNRPTFAFYAPPNGPDQALIEATESSLTSFNIRTFPLVGECVYADQKAKIKPDDNVFVPGSLRVSGPLIHIKNRDGLVLSFFADIRKNRLDYLKTSIYPRLTAKDSSDAGL